MNGQSTAVLRAGGRQPAMPKPKLFPNGTTHADTLYVIRHVNGEVMAAFDTPEQCARQAFMFDTPDAGFEMGEYKLLKVSKKIISIKDYEEKKLNG